MLLQREKKQGEERATLGARRPADAYVEAEPETEL